MASLGQVLLDNEKSSIAAQAPEDAFVFPRGQEIISDSWLNELLRNCGEAAAWNIGAAAGMLPESHFGCLFTLRNVFTRKEKSEQWVAGDSSEAGPTQSCQILQLAQAAG